MININIGSVLASPNTNNASVGAPSAGPAVVTASASKGTESHDTVTLSSASQATASPIAAASDPYSGLSTAQLQVIHSRVMQELSTGYWATAATNDSQLPEPATPDRIASAQSATACLHGTGPNPFKSLSRDALTAIGYDESGKYTLNERSAALGQQENNDSAYVTLASDLSSATGDSRYLDSALLQINQHLSPVEAAVSNQLMSLSTPTQQLIGMLNEADSQHGGPLTTNLPYPGGW